MYILVKTNATTTVADEFNSLAEAKRIKADWDKTQGNTSCLCLKTIKEELSIDELAKYQQGI